MSFQTIGNLADAEALQFFDGKLKSKGVQLNLHEYWDVIFTLCGGNPGCVVDLVDHVGGVDGIDIV